MAVSGTPAPSSARLLSGPSHEQATIYRVSERNGVICITVAALISLVAVLYLLLVQTPRPKTYRKTHLFGYILSLLLSNIIQASTTAMNLEWIVHRGISPGLFCFLQGGGEQLGNLGMALWSCMISIHMFNLLFLRAASNRLSYAAALVFGWTILVFLVIIGPLLVQTPQRGPYFGISGESCGIRNAYALERVFLEFVLELFSAATSLTLYLIILLRVRGNLVRSKGAWTLRFIPREESWKLAFGRDLIDTSMLKVAQIMVWYPIAYTAVLLPVAITRMSNLSGRQTPPIANVLCSVFFNFTGLLNVLLLIYTQKHFPNLEDVPEFNTPRQKKRLTWLNQAEGVTPYSIRRSVSAEKYNRERRTTLSRAQSLRYPDSAHTVTSRSSSDFSLDAMVHEHYKQMV